LHALPQRDSTFATPKLIIITPLTVALSMPYSTTYSNPPLHALTRRESACATPAAATLQGGAADSSGMLRNSGNTQGGAALPRIPQGDLRQEGDNTQGGAALQLPPRIPQGGLREEGPQRRPSLPDYEARYELPGQQYEQGSNATTDYTYNTNSNNYNDYNNTQEGSLRYEQGSNASNDYTTTNSHHYNNAPESPLRYEQRANATSTTITTNNNNNTNNYYNSTPFSISQGGNLPFSDANAPFPDAPPRYSAGASNSSNLYQHRMEENRPFALDSPLASFNFRTTTLQHAVQIDDNNFTPNRHLLPPGQRRHSPQRHTAPGTAAPTTTDRGETLPQRANPNQTGYTHPQSGGQVRGQGLGALQVGSLAGALAPEAAAGGVGAPVISVSTPTGAGVRSAPALSLDEQFGTPRR